MRIERIMIDEGKSMGVVPQQQQQQRRRDSEEKIAVSVTNAGSIIIEKNIKSSRINDDVDDRLMYATIDSLALKRATLPLQLLPIDDEAFVDVPLIDRDNKGEEDEFKRREIEQRGRVAANRVPMRSFKVSGRQTVLGTSQHRQTAVPAGGGESENALSKEIADSSPVITEKTIEYRNDDRETTTTTTSELCSSSRDDAGLPDVKRAGNENSKMNNRSSNEYSRSNVIIKIAPSSDENINERTKIERNDSSMDDDYCRASGSSDDRSSLKKFPQLDESKAENLEIENKYSFFSMQRSDGMKKLRCSQNETTNKQELGDKITRNKKKFTGKESPLISLPMNFVHVSSAASSRFFAKSDDTGRGKVVDSYCLENSQRRCEPQQGVVLKSSKITDSRVPSVAPSELSANASFLWGSNAGRASRRINETRNRNEKCIFNDTDKAKRNCEEDAYDDVGIADIEEDDYDDVGRSAVNDLYDDVAAAAVAPLSSRIRNKKITASNIDKEYNENFVKICHNDIIENYEDRYLSIGNDYSSLDGNEEEDQADDDTYDDVQIVSQDRVNSLYSGSGPPESEWEDLDDAQTILRNNNLAPGHADSQSSKKKHRRSRNIRAGRRSKGSRKNESGSRVKSCSSVAVSLGTGSILLLVGGSNSPDNCPAAPSNEIPDLAAGNNSDSSSYDTKFIRTSSSSSSSSSSRGLVQLRILERHDSIDTQETSCYVLQDTGSDDSNYETLFSSFPSDEFSSGDEDSVVNSSLRATSIDDRVDHQREAAPSRPVPPPPRESSLTETLGKRMKMLRRTWSITKGSLGRIRRRTLTSSAENDTSNMDDEGGNKYTNFQQPVNDSRKYFSFKKHFRKNVTALSTFYLEMNENGLTSNDNRSKEEIYSNSSSESNCYTNTEYWKNSKTDNIGDHYSMLDVEPLYQFYAAAAARVAFESDSEGYEEVQMPSAVDLAKPGHRTLWCQTPQVMGSALLQRLTPDEKKCQEAKFEMLTSEASYLNSLRVLVDEFLNNHDLIHEILAPSERDKLFGGVPSLLIESERLLAEFEAVWREDPMLDGLPELLLNYAERSSSVYVAYCSNQVGIDTTLQELRSKKGSKFVDTITRIESHPACQSLSLHSFLMLPMQRVTRLPLLADAVLSKLSTTSNMDERKRWECALSRLSQVVIECNEGARAAGRLAEMEALERKLEYSSAVPPIVLRDRYLIRRGPVVQILPKSDATDYKLTFGKKYHKLSLYLFLLTDHLLIAKSKSSTSEETYTVIDTCKRSLVELEKVSEDSPFAGRNAMVLALLENYSGRHVEYIVTCDNATERERWLDAISPPKSSSMGESLYETWDCPQVMALYPYAAAQPDELTVHPGDVINVLRKMSDGWHLGEKLLGGEQGWFPGNYAKEVASEHVRARNLRQRHRLLVLSTSVLQQRAKQTSR